MKTITIILFTLFSFANTSYSQIKVSDIDSGMKDLGKTVNAYTKIKDTTVFVFYRNRYYRTIVDNRGFYFALSELDTIYNTIANAPIDKDLHISLNSKFELLCSWVRSMGSKKLILIVLEDGHKQGALPFFTKRQFAKLFDK